LISYSKPDHALVLKLSAFLEAEGWSVWWDKSLAAADLYRDEIMKQLAAARAVISIWTPNSLKSDWVRAEAGRAKADGKLIPVKTADVAYADIPLPFGEMHTENLESTDLVRAAVVAQLAKPAAEPSAWRLLIKGFNYELLTWVGIVGGALTLFGTSNVDKYPEIIGDESIARPMWILIATLLLGELRTQTNLGAGDLGALHRSGDCVRLEL